MVAVIAAFVLVTALCVPFLLTDQDVPTAVVLGGRYLPAVASLVAIVAVLGRGHLTRLWRLRPASPRELFASYGLALAVMVPALVAPALAGLLVGADLKPAEVLLAAVPMVVLGTVLFALSTFGEEVLWRGQLQTALHRLGFWRSALVVGVVWMLWHLPLHLTYLSVGVLTGEQVVASTLGIAAWAPLLAALVERRGTVWPAVLAHAVPLSSVQLLTEASVQDAVPFWTVTVLSWVALVAAALVVRGHAAGTSSGVASDTAVPDVVPSTVSQTSISR
jgi:membrane protease YdiL (CAAX protease family)